jgi:hypothetical protein
MTQVILNGTAPQAGANFNITGTGTAGALKAGHLDVIDGTGALRGGLYPLSSDSMLTVGGASGLGFYADGSWTAPSPAPQMGLDPNGSMHLTHALQPGTISSSGTTVTGAGTQFSTSWVGQYIVWATADGIRDGAVENVYAKITAVSSATDMTVDRELDHTGIGIPNSGMEKF